MPASRRLKVGYIVFQFPPEVGAGPARVMETATRWREVGGSDAPEVTFITPFPHRSIPGQPDAYGVIEPRYRGQLFVEEELQGFRVIRSWLYSSPAGGFVRTVINNATFMATAAANALARLGPADVLIASAPPLFTHLSGVMVSTLKGIPLILEVRDLWPDYLVGMGLLRRGAVTTNALFALERWMLKRADRVVVVTESFRENIIAKGISPDRVHVLPNGVDLQLYHPSTEPPPIAAVERHGDEFIVGYLGTFGAGQALSNVVEAAKLVEARDPNIRFVLVGDGPDRRRVEEKVRELAPSNLTLAPTIRRDQTRAFYNACDVCLAPLAPIPVFQETIPSKIFEIMACGRPVLGSFGGEGRKIVEASSGGLAVPPGDARAMADAVLSMKAMGAGERATMGAQGRAFVTTHYERTRIADRYLELVRETASSRR
jgi:colanic acid biosynthesis glycosyl transferase WcaI